MLHHALIQILTLLCIALVVGMGARRFALPYTLSLVVAGIGLGFLHLEELEGLHLTPDLLLALFLPPLLFEAAYHIDVKKFRRDAAAILLLAVPGVLVAVAVTGGLSTALLGAAGVSGFTLGHGLLLGSVIAATDPISVLALFKTLGVHKRLYILVEGESLLNDGVAVVVFLIVAAVLGIETGYAAPPGLDTASAIAVYGVKTFVWMAGMGTLVGALAGVTASVVTSRVDDRLIEVAITVVVAYGSFLLAEEFHASGVLACVASGVVMGSYGARVGMSPLTRVAVVDFWEMMAFFSNTFIFLLIGIELDVVALVGAGGLVALVFVSVLAGRAVVVYGGLPLARLLGVERMPGTWSHVMVWGGLRGSLSMVLVIGLPPDYPARTLLLLLVFGVVSLSLFVQGLTMKPLLRRLGVVEDPTLHTPYETARGRSLMAARALRELDRQHREGAVPADAYARLHGWYGGVRERAEEAARALAGEHLAAERLSEAALHLLTVEEEALRHAADEGQVGGDAARALLLEIAARREALKHGELDEALGGG